MRTKNIWEINSLFYCPIAGFCLTQNEQNSILKKYLDLGIKSNTEIENHHLLIEHLHNENKISKEVQNLLNKKYSKILLFSKELDTIDFFKCRDDFLKPENFGAFIWISASCIELTKKEEEQIYYKIHIYSHKIYFDLIFCQKKYNKLSDNYNEINSKYKELKSQLKQTKQENLSLISENNQLSAKVKNMDNNSDMELKKEIQKKQEEANTLKLIIENQTKEIASLKIKNEKQRSIAENNKEQINILKNDFECIMKSFEEQNNQCSECEKIDLCNKRVLIVGGMSKMKAFYHDLVVKLGGEFYHHEGYCNSSQSQNQLSYFIYKSDIVICPVDVNSHAACLHVKKVCKEARKKYYMLRKSSLSSVYNTLVSAK